MKRSIRNMDLTRTTIAWPGGVVEAVSPYACTHRLRKSRANLKHWPIDTQVDDQSFLLRGHARIA